MVVLLVVVATAQDFVARRNNEEINDEAKDESDQTESKDKTGQRPDGKNFIVHLFVKYSWAEFSCKILVQHNLC